LVLFFKKELLPSCMLAFASLRLEHFQPDRNRPSEAGGPRLIKMLYKQQAGAARRMPMIFQSGRSRSSCITLSGYQAWDSIH
jgi:hypothetical protein